MSIPGLKFLDRSLSIVPKGFNRWLVPPAALAVHMCIGQIYAYSVFNKPMTKIIGITESAPDDWKLTTLGGIFSIALFVLGAFAAAFGRWIEIGAPKSHVLSSYLLLGRIFYLSRWGVYPSNNPDLLGTRSC